MEAPGLGVPLTPADREMAVEMQHVAPESSSQGIEAFKDVVFGSVGLFPVLQVWSDSLLTYLLFSTSDSRNCRQIH
jgi:hypothetical protein